MATQQIIDNLIEFIDNAQDPESVTNEMVAAVLNHLNKGYKDLLTNNSAVATEKEERQAADDAIQKAIEAVRLALQMVSNTATEAHSTANALNSKIGQPNGIAPLDESGRIPARHIPGAYDDVLEFAGFIESVPEIKEGGYGIVSPYGGAIYFCIPLSRFIYRANLRNPLEDPMEDAFEYWNTWPNAEGWGEYDEKGHIPERGKIYVDIHRNKSYRWSGTTLASLNDGVALGYTPQTAFPGDEGLAAAKDATEALSRLDRLDVLPVDYVLDSHTKLPEHPKPKLVAWLKDICAFYISSEEDWNVLEDNRYNIEIKPDCWVGSPLNVYSHGAKLYILRGTVPPPESSADVWFELVDYNQAVIDDVELLRTRVDGIGVLPFNGFWSSRNRPPVRGILYTQSEDEDRGWFLFYGPDNTAANRALYNTDPESERPTARTDVVFRCNNSLYGYDDELGMLQAIGGAGADGLLNERIKQLEDDMKNLKSGYEWNEV